MGNSSSDRTSGGQPGGKEARSNILIDSSEDADLFQREDSKALQEIQEFLAWQQDLESDSKRTSVTPVFTLPQAVMTSKTRTVNNVIQVRRMDFEVFDALKVDSQDSADLSDLSSSPPGPYQQDGYVVKSEDKLKHPPILPPHLLQVLLNKDTGISCDPTLLPEPNHIMLNHLYALSIKDGVIVLSATHRYKKKYVTTLLYKPI